jgi:hypothetical protein
MTARKTGALNSYSEILGTRFPVSAGLIRRLSEESSSFAALCAEHADCAQALEYWKRSTTEEAERIQREYAILLLELEEEIRSYLEDIEQLAATGKPVDG